MAMEKKEKKIASIHKRLKSFSIAYKADKTIYIWQSMQQINTAYFWSLSSTHPSTPSLGRATAPCALTIYIYFPVF